MLSKVKLQVRLCRRAGDPVALRLSTV
jgi:hypothetical protein